MARPVDELRECVGKIRGGVMIERRTRPCCEFAIAGAVVGMQVRRDDGLDSHPELFGEFQMARDLELRIHDRGAALAGSTEQV